MFSNKIKASVFLLISLSFQITLAGWVSSGGELFRFDKNPWFVKNTRKVYYCINFDKSSMSVNEKEAKLAILEALNYWKRELKQNIPGRALGIAKIGNQEFEEIGNCVQADLAFNFGIGSLSKDEIQFLKDPKKYVGVTVRKTYQDMKGKGFIYVSSDLGPYAYDNPGHLISKAWENSKLFQYALIHELGHVFGIPHTGTGVMSEVFLDQLLHKRFYKFYLKQKVLSFLKPLNELQICELNGNFNHVFFKIESNTKCIKLKSTNESLTKWDVLAQLTDKDPFAKRGELILTSSTMKNYSPKPAVIVHIPESSSVYTQSERVFGNFMIGPVFMGKSYRGFYRTVDSKRPFSVFVDLDTTHISIVSQVGTKIQPVLTYSPSSLADLVIPIDME